MPAPDDDLVTAIINASRALVAIAAHSIEAAPVEVTLAQFRAVALLDLQGPLPMSELGRGLELSPSSTTRLVERLERKALVRRHVSPTSRRSTEVGLTTEGEMLVELVLSTRRALITEVLASVPAGRRPALLDAFREFALAAGEPPAARRSAAAATAG